MRPRQKPVNRTVTVQNAGAIGAVDGDRVYIRKSLVALLRVPTPGFDMGGSKEYTFVEIMSIKPGHFAIAKKGGAIIHNVGLAWEIHYHVRTYLDTREKAK